MPLQLIYLKKWVLCFSFFILSLGGWFWNLPCNTMPYFYNVWHLIYLAPCTWYTKVVWPYIQQFLHWEIPRFMFVPWIVPMWLSILKDLLIRSLALKPLWVSHILIQITAISDLRDVLITWGQKARTISLKMYVDWMTFSTMSDVMEC